MSERAYVLYTLHYISCIMARLEVYDTSHIGQAGNQNSLCHPMSLT